MATVRIGVVVLAAGEGSRMGGPKALLPWRGRAMVAAVCDLFPPEAVDERIVVLGYQAERVRAEAGLASQVRVLVNEGHRQGMLSSVLAGLEEASRRDLDAVLLHPVDHPMVEAGTIAAVLGALRGGAVIAVPSHGGRRGHPAGYARAAWDALREAPRDQGARAVLAHHPEWVVHIPAGPLCLEGINTPDDYRRLLRLPSGP